MTDINFTQLAANLPASAIVADAPNNDVVVSLKALMGETAVALTDAKVGELLSRLLDAASLAQNSYNADVANTTDIRSYPSPALGTPTRDPDDGAFYCNFTYTMSVLVPLDKSQVEAIEV